MKKLYFILFLLASSTLLQAQYNTLTIPEAYYGTSGADGVTFNLSIKDTVKHNYAQQEIQRLRGQYLVPI